MYAKVTTPTVHLYFNFNLNGSIYEGRKLDHFPSGNAITSIYSFIPSIVSTSFHQRTRNQVAKHI